MTSAGSCLLPTAWGFLTKLECDALEGEGRSGHQSEQQQQQQPVKHSSWRANCTRPDASAVGQLVRACVRACVITGIFRFARARDKTQYMISLRACMKEGGAGQNGESSKKWEMNSTPSLEPQQESGDVRGLLRRDWLSWIQRTYAPRNILPHLCNSSPHIRA